MEAPSIHRLRLINRITEALEISGGGITFHDVVSAGGNDVTFIESPPDVEIFFQPGFLNIGKPDTMQVPEELKVTWDDLSDEILEEIFEILNECNQGITY